VLKLRALDPCRTSVLNRGLHLESCFCRAVCVACPGDAFHVELSRWRPAESALSLRALTLLQYPFHIGKSLFEGNSEALSFGLGIKCVYLPLNSLHRKSASTWT